ncbi:hypothetical protein BRC83_04920 [Halobacteriales archaeon QS_1_68_17]|nr:MAG: hypothetical protein BRC83_04920 [Halobacteriales archaeon QS_1_68_17]
MRPVTRNFLVGVLAVVALLLALGAVPGYLKSGDPHYLTATPADGPHPSVNASGFPAERYPYLTSALDSASATEPGRSDPYWRGPLGLKGVFTHSPFDEVDAVRARNASAADGDAVYVTANGTLYRVAVARPT